MKKYRIYPSLLDQFQTFLDSSEVYQQYWGNSDNPTKTEEQFEQELFQGLLDRINRVSTEVTEAISKGVAFEEVVNCIIEQRTSEKMDMSSNYETGMIDVSYNDQEFQFSAILCKEFANYFKNAISQVFVKGDLETKYGTVELYGYVDMLLPIKACDIKTTGQYKAFKYRKNWQHRVYPFCLQKMGNDIKEFEYNVTDFRHSWTETYNYTDETENEIREIVERFIEFLEEHRELITDKKIFNQL